MAWIDGLRRKQHETLRSVDVQIGRLLDALEETGRLHDTLIVFTSDNGLLWGEHRWMKKEVPYDEALRVPMVVRFDRAEIEPRSDDHLVVNVDIAPDDRLDRVGAVPRHRRHESGIAARRRRRPWRQDFLIEHMEGRNPVPSYCGVRTRRRSTCGT